MKITIAKIGNNKTVEFAVEELKKYLKMIDSELFIDVHSYEKYDDKVKNVVWVGLDPAFEVIETEDKTLDDAILIDIAENVGVITGANPRSVLIAVYRFLKELGCAWVRASIDGEVIPSYTMTPITMYISEEPSYRHRAICIEGATSYEHVISMIDWIPKASMNGYHTQFFLPYEFFDRWYSHRENPYYESENVTEADVAAMVKSMEEEIAKRDLIYHTVGHGWTSEPLGFDSSGWHEEGEREIPDDKRILLAEMNGERAFLKGTPMLTNLCYSNPRAREIMTDAVAEYCISHPHAKIVHFWLADSPNSFCECEQCRDTLPSDHYVMLLNELDEKLTKAGCNTKIVFLVYYDLLWAPEKEKIKNPDRFTAMFAPITRTYSQSYKDEKFDDVEVAPFVRNKLNIPKSVAENVAHLKKWLDITKVSDSFDFDYHIMWDHHRDTGYFNSAKTLFDDMQNLDRLGLRGMVSCQLTRAAYPTNLPMQMMADALWDKECDFEEKSDEYYLSAFGSDGLSVKKYTRKISTFLDTKYTRIEMPAVNEEMAKKFAKAYTVLIDFAPVIKKNLEEVLDENVRKSWEYLEHHNRMAKMVAKGLKRRAEGASPEELKQIQSEICDFIYQTEMQVHRVLDGHMYPHVIRGMIF